MLRPTDRRLQQDDDLLIKAMRVHGPFTDLGAFRGYISDLSLRRRSLLGCAPNVQAETSIELPTYLADLHLAQACAQHPRIDAAWRRILGLHFDQLLKCARGFSKAAPEVEVNEFFADLWLVRKNNGNLLSTYAGLAPLGSWLQLVLRRRLVRRTQRSANWQSLPPEQVDPRAHPPELAARAEFLSAMSGSLQQSLEGLSQRDRAFVEARLLHCEEGVSLAKRYGVSTSYVSRRSREVLESLRSKMTPLLHRFGLDQEALK